MSLLKIKKQNLEIIKKNQPELYKSINKNLEHLSEQDKGIVAGIVIEFVIQSGGNTDVFLLGDDTPKRAVEEDEYLYRNLFQEPEVIKNIPLSHEAADVIDDKLEDILRAEEQEKDRIESLSNDLVDTMEELRKFGEDFNSIETSEVSAEIAKQIFDSVDALKESLQSIYDRYNMKEVSQKIVNSKKFMI